MYVFTMPLIKPEKEQIKLLGFDFLKNVDMQIILTDIDEDQYENNEDIESEDDNNPRMYKLNKKHALK